PLSAAFFRSCHSPRATLDSAHISSSMSHSGRAIIFKAGLFFEPGSPTTAMKRFGASSHVSRRASVVAWPAAPAATPPAIAPRQSSGTHMRAEAARHSPASGAGNTAKGKAGTSTGGGTIGSSHSPPPSDGNDNNDRNPSGASPGPLVAPLDRPL